MVEWTSLLIPLRINQPQPKHNVLYVPHTLYRTTRTKHGTIFTLKGNRVINKIFHFFYLESLILKLYKQDLVN